jgi:hypothetical protein
MDPETSASQLALTFAGVECVADPGWSRRASHGGLALARMPAPDAR